MTRHLPSPQCHGAEAAAAWPASRGTKGSAVFRHANIGMCVCVVRGITGHHVARG